MSSKLIGILFLVLVPLFIIGMIGAFIYNIVSGKKGEQEIIAFARSNNWEYFKNQNAELEQLLSNTLYLVEKERAKRKISNIIKGNFRGINFWYAFYKSPGRNNMPNRDLTFSRNWNIFVVPVNYSGERFMIFNAKKIPELFSVEKLIQLTGHKLSKPEQSELQDYYSDNIKSINDLKLSSRQLEQLNTVLSKTHSVHFFNHLLIYAVEKSTLLNPDEMKEHLENIKILVSLINSVSTEHN